MKLKGLLKNKVDSVDSKAQNKSVIEDAGIELSYDELTDVVGGISIAPIKKPEPRHGVGDRQ